MSWSASVSDVALDELNDKIVETFQQTSPEALPSVIHAADEAADAVGVLAIHAFPGSNEGKRFNASTSGHINQGEDDPVESFISVVVTERAPKPEAQSDPAED